jgi:uncharacterized protein (TIGR02145 family)
MNGVEEYTAVGNVITYMTHEFATGPGGTSQCWMVNNSMEGNYAAKCYNDDCATYGFYGSYYTYIEGHNNTSCPEGWHIPSLAEGNNMIAFLNSSSSLSPIDLRKWWTGTTATSTAFGGEYYVGDAKFNGVGVRGEYWYDTAASCLVFIGYASGIPVDTRTYSNRWYQVRCVK